MLLHTSSPRIHCEAWTRKSPPNWRCTRRVETPVWHRGTLCIPSQNTCVSRVSRRLDRGALAIKASNVMMNSSEEWRTVKKDGSRCHLFHLRWATRFPFEETCSSFWSVFISRRAFISHVLTVCQCACDICEISNGKWHYHITSCGAIVRFRFCWTYRTVRCTILSLCAFCPFD